MSEQIYCVYKHTSPSGKAYIGQTNNYKRRESEHRNHSRVECRSFQNAIKKYGWDNFKHEILKENLNLEEANYWEIKLINDLKTFSPNGYNLKGGGNGVSHSQETIQKMIATRSKKEYRDAHSIRQKLIHNDPERKALASKKTTDYFKKEENRKAQSIRQKECQNRPEVLIKKSEASKKALSDPLIRKKISDGVKLSREKEGYKEKVSEAMKKSHARPEVRKRLSDSIKKAQSKEGYKEKISIALKLALSNKDVKEKMSIAGKNRQKREKQEKIDREKKIAIDNKSLLFSWMQTDLF